MTAKKKQFPNKANRERRVMARNHASAVTEGNITSSGGDLDISAPEVRWGDRWFELNIPRGDTNGVGEDEVTVGGVGRA